MTPFLDQAQQARLLTEGARRIMGAVKAAGGEARLVGGAVRDLLLNREIGDRDLAVNLPPERVMEILARQGIKTVPTGLAHGTITAVVDHVGYEMTTLRRDVETDGRHAQVVFTDDWRADAARRDFTLNALSVDAAGRIYDYFDGVADAAAGRVHFIGDAQARIREDVLRILRFFRFHAWFGKGEADAEALAACRALADLIPRLSAERVTRELLKLLSAENPLPAWRLMEKCGVIPHVAPEAADIPRLQALLEREKKFDERQAPLTRFAALLPQDKAMAAAHAARLKLSRRDGETLGLLAALPSLLRGMKLRRVLYAYGLEACRAAVFLEGVRIPESLAMIDAWESPVFPVKGEDILKLGIPVGPRVGEILHSVEEWWIASDFHATRDACLDYARNLQSEKESPPPRGEG